MELKNVTLKHRRQLILHHCSVNLPSQSIILANIVIGSIASYEMKLEPQ
ncbi:hypothetical protein [Geobacillus thermoleovorans]|nr:hypothetical protein [Geobacillus thermoleovorans]MBW7641967.1 hypothetical protein [Geobacillus thermoleovorans]